MPDLLVHSYEIRTISPAQISLVVGGKQGYMVKSMYISLDPEVPQET